MEPVELRALVQCARGRWVGDAPSPDTRVADISTDTRSLGGRPLYLALSGERFDGHEFVLQAKRAGAVASVVAEKRLRSLPREGGPYVVVDDPLAAFERMGEWNRSRRNVRVIGITGSVGKTSVKEFLASLLSTRLGVTAAPRSFNNRIGVAATLLAAGPSTEVIIAELGTSGPGELSHLSKVVRPDVVVLTEIAPTHLEGLRDLDGVARAKAEVFDGFAPDGRAFIRAGTHGFDMFCERAGGRVETFGWGPGSGRKPEPRADRVITDCVRVGLGDPRSIHGVKAYGYHFTVDDTDNFLVPVPGVHNVVNALAALSVARHFGIDDSEIRFGLSSCRLLPLRLQVVEAGGVVFVNDCYNASPLSVRAAIDEWSELAESVPGASRLVRRSRSPGQVCDGSSLPVPGPVAVLGDMLELGSQSRRLHAEVGERLIETGVRLLVTVGSDSRWIFEAYQALGGQAICRHFTAAEDAIPFLRREVRAGDHVLLKGSRRIGLERVFEGVHRWVRLHGGPAFVEVGAPMRTAMI